MQLLMGMSTSLYLPASGTAGLQRYFVSGYKRVPRPPPMIMLITFFVMSCQFLINCGVRRFAGGRRGAVEIPFRPRRRRGRLKSESAFARAENSNKSTAPLMRALSTLFREKSSFFLRLRNSGKTRTKRKPFLQARRIGRKLGDVEFERKFRLLERNEVLVRAEHKKLSAQDEFF